MIMTKWYQSKEVDNIVISNRIRLARNVKDYQFPVKMNQEEALEIISKMKDTVGKIEGYTFQCIELNALDQLEKKAMIEEHIMSPYMLGQSVPRMVIFNQEKTISIMVNEEDHIRLQGIGSGEDIMSTWLAVSQLDDAIEEHIPYAFSEEYGYMTSCPTNLGTGLRASYMLHLPLLEKTKYLQQLFVSVSKLGMSIRGIYGEGTKSLGSIYQISNQQTLGRTEEEVIESMRHIAMHIVDKEQNIRDNIVLNPQSKLKDKIYRSYGILAYARQLALPEAMNLLSDIKLGFEMGIYDMPRLQKSIYEIMISIQEATIIKSRAKEDQELPVDVIRANIIRKYLK